jgi:hypothetical protein
MTAAQMTAVSGRPAALVGTELRRYARHPVFLLGALATAVGTVLSVPKVNDDFYSPPVIPAFFLGVFGMVVGFRLTRSLERSAEAMASTPVSMQERVKALLLACLLPGALGLIAGIAMLTLPDVDGDWVYGTWAGHERVAIVLGQTAIASLGGPMLGVAAARWLRFPGAVVVPVVVIVTWVIVSNGWSSSNQDSTGWLLARMFTPFTYFTTIDTNGPHHIESWRGNPWFYLVWLLILCAITVIVALMKGAEGDTRTTLRRALVVATVAALAAFTLAVVTGADHTTVSTPSGVSRI